MCPQTARLCITNVFTDSGVAMGKRGISADSWHEKIPRGSSFKFICKPVEAMNELGLSWACVFTWFWVGSI